MGVRLDPRWGPGRRPGLGPAHWLRLGPGHRLWLGSGRQLRLGPGRRFGRAALALLLVGLIALAGYGYASTRDKTKGMRPEQVVQAAGMALANASAYRFTVALTGESPDGSFPSAHMQGKYRREPPLLHLAGEAGSGAAGASASGATAAGTRASGAGEARTSGVGSLGAKVSLEYYLDRTALFLKVPATERWLRLTKPNLDELQAFQPARLATPLISGLRSATIVGRERLSGREALVLKLDLDPSQMRILPTGKAGRVEPERIDYRLWVHTSTLRPMAFTIRVSGRGDGQGDAESSRYASAFQYRITWDYRRLGRFSVPASVREQATIQ